MENHLYKTIIESSNEGVWLFDSNYLTTYVNPKIEELIGYDRSEMIGHSIFNFVKNEKNEDLKNCMSKTSASIFEVEVITKNGHSIFIRFNSSPLLENSKLVGRIAMICDITEKREIDRRDQENLRHYLSLFDDSPIPIWEEDFSEIKIALDALKANGITNFKEYFHSNPSEIIRLANLMIVNNINNAVVELNEASSKEEVLMNYQKLVTDDSFQYIVQQMEAIALGKNECQFDAELITLKGNIRHIHFRWKVVNGFEHNYKKVYLTTTDFTDRIKEENLVLQQSNREKETLLKEIHHRVKNNLQIISSLLRLQAHANEDETIKNIIDVSLNRISSMSAVHEMLYRSSEYSKIDYKEYLETLINSLLDTISDHQTIQFQIEVEEIVLSIETAIPLGLLINEIFTNSIKHAFEEGNQGIVYIRIKTTPSGKFLLEIGDNGKGIQTDIQHCKSETLGLSLIDNLAKQLDGNLQIQSGVPGTHYVLQFAPN